MKLLMVLLILTIFILGFYPFSYADDLDSKIYKITDGVIKQYKYEDLDWFNRTGFQLKNSGVGSGKYCGVSRN